MKAEIKTGQKHKMLRPEEIDFDTRTLNYMIAIAEEGGLSRAAEKLYLSQPALSRYLRGVEDALGTPLFSRSHNRLTLTNAGKVFINGARSMLNIEETIQAQLKVSRENQKNTLVVAAHPLFADFLKKRVHPRLAEKNPELCLSLNERSGDEVRRLIANGSVDLGFFMGDLTENTYLSQECMLTSELVFCAAANSPALLRCKRDRFRLRDFAGEPMLMSLENTFLYGIQNRLLQENGIFSPEVSARGHLSVLASLITLGYGNVILPAETPGLPQERCFSLEPPEPYSCIAAWNRERPLSTPAQQYLNLAQEIFPQFMNLS